MFAKWASYRNSRHQLQLQPNYELHALQLWLLVMASGECYGFCNGLCNSMKVGHCSSSNLIMWLVLWNLSCDIMSKLSALFNASYLEFPSGVWPNSFHSYQFNLDSRKKCKGIRMHWNISICRMIFLTS